MRAQTVKKQILQKMIARNEPIRAAFGGLAAWGFLGIFLGPLILSLFVFFLDTYRNAWDLYQQEGREDAPS